MDGALKVPFMGPPGRETNVWSHSANEYKYAGL